jgi:hypothetical protein
MAGTKSRRARLGSQTLTRDSVLYSTNGYNSVTSWRHEGGNSIDRGTDPYVVVPGLFWS